MAKHSVVVYGASGYTGMLIMDWLIDQNIPFTAVARSAARTREMMAQRVVRRESAVYEIIEASHGVESLTRAFDGARIVCNTVGPFVNFGLTAIEAALAAIARGEQSGGPSFGAFRRAGGGADPASLVPALVAKGFPPRVEDPALLVLQHVPLQVVNQRRGVDLHDPVLRPVFPTWPIRSPLRTVDPTRTAVLERCP